MPPPETETARWFSAEVQPHEPALRGYLRGSFPAVRDVDDVVQESYLRMWRARAVQPIQSARGFLFTVARRLALDLVRREAVSPMRGVCDLANLPVLEERPSVLDRLGEEEKIRLLAKAVGSLPTRCRQAVVLHKINGLSQREVAAQLGLSEKTVENQVALGIKRCEEFFRRRGIERF
ncbi:MAG: RNA polymerase sigma factor [Verrucomicrobiota bacterium]